MRADGEPIDCPNAHAIVHRCTSDSFSRTPWRLSGPTIPARYLSIFQRVRQRGKHLLKIGVLVQSLPLHGLKSFHNCNLSSSLETFSLCYFLCISSFFVLKFMFFLPPVCLVPEKVLGNATKWVENFESLIIAFILCFFFISFEFLLSSTSLSLLIYIRLLCLVAEKSEEKRGKWSNWILRFYVAF